MENLKIPAPHGKKWKINEDGSVEAVDKDIILEKGKDYIDKFGAIIIDRKGRGNINLGWIPEGDFYTDLYCSYNNCREATNEEVVQAFKKELVKKYGENWENVKIKKTPNGLNSSNKAEYNIEIRKYYDGWRVYNKNSLLYENGKWAEPLEEPKYPESYKEVPLHIRSISSIDTVSFRKLIALRDAVWEIDDWKPDWSSRDYKFTIIAINNHPTPNSSSHVERPLVFKTVRTRNWFLKTHKELIQKCIDLNLL